VLDHHRTGSGPPLLLLHGVGSQWQMWEPVLATLARERDVIAVDLPGFGESPALEGEPTVAALASAVAGHIAALGLERPDVAGNSLGGGIALELGARGLVRTVCCLSPIGFARGREGAYGRATLRASYAAARVLAPVAGAVVTNPAVRTLAFAHLMARPWRMPPDAAAGAMRNLARTEGMRAALDAVAPWRPAPQTGPTTIAWGERDRLLLRSRQAPRAAREHPGARHLVLHGCGHVPTWDDPEQVARVILEASAG
jgi:pimeloyl-ACP methyl ester carboxylesterase